MFMFMFGLGRSSVIAGARGAVGNVKAAIDAHDGVQIDDDGFDEKVENVEARSRMIPCGLGPGTGRSVIDRDAERGAESQQRGGKEKDLDLGAETTRAELLEGSAAWNEPRDHGDHKRQKGDQGKVRPAVELDAAVDGFRPWPQGVEGLNRHHDHHDEGDDDEREDGDEDRLEGPMPSDVRMHGPQNALSEDDVDDEEENDAGGHKDPRGNGERDMRGMGGPGDAHSTGHYPGHTESEQEA